MEHGTNFNEATQNMRVQCWNSAWLQLAQVFIKDNSHLNDYIWWEFVTDVHNPLVRKQAHRGWGEVTLGQDDFNEVQKILFTDADKVYQTGLVKLALI